MTIKTRAVDYEYAGVALQAHLAFDDAWGAPRPAVLVCHAWGGRGDFENTKAEQLAQLGYVGFAADVYGKGILGSGPEENTKLMSPLLDDRAGLQGRLLAAVDKVRSQTEVDSQRVGAIGFCFGGLCVLDLARVGADLRGVASFHGLFGSPGNTGGTPIRAKVLVLHGWDDPMATPDQAIALGKELTAAGADWQLHAYGNTVHAFTNPAANNAEGGMVYNDSAARRSWQTLQGFLAEAFT